MVTASGVGDRCPGKHDSRRMKFFWRGVYNEAVDVKRVVNANEPLKPDGSTNYVQKAFFRESKWLEIVGANFVELAFRFAHEADPSATLIYNDYGMTEPAKVDFVIQHIV